MSYFREVKLPMNCHVYRSSEIGFWNTLTIFIVLISIQNWNKNRNRPWDRDAIPPISPKSDSLKSIHFSTQFIAKNPRVTSESAPSFELVGSRTWPLVLLIPMAIWIIKYLIHYMKTNLRNWPGTLDLISLILNGQRISTAHGGCAVCVQKVEPPQPSGQAHPGRSFTLFNPPPPVGRGGRLAQASGSACELKWSDEGQYPSEITLIHPALRVGRQEPLRTFPALLLRQWARANERWHHQQHLRGCQLIVAKRLPFGPFKGFICVFWF